MISVKARLKQADKQTSIYSQWSGGSLSTVKLTSKRRSELSSVYNELGTRDFGMKLANLEQSNHAVALQLTERRASDGVLNGLLGIYCQASSLPLLSVVQDDLTFTMHASFFLLGSL